MRFKLDENLPQSLAELLATRGFDADTVYDEGLAGASDATVHERVKLDQRVLLTFDVDFADIRRYPIGSHSGIVVFRIRDQRWAVLRPLVEELLAEGTLDTLNGGLAIVDERRIRIRRGVKSATPVRRT